MLNIEKFLSLLKERGVSQAHIGRVFGKSRHFVLDIKNGATTLNDEQIKIVAEILQTTPEYLTDQTEEKGIKKETARNDDLNARFVKLFMRLSPEEQEREIAFLESKVASQDK